MGNPLFKNYNADKDPFLTGGFHNLWKIYKGSRKDRKQDVCIFVCEKKSLEKYGKDEREEILNVLKKEASAIAKYKHPAILSLVEQMVEDKTTIAFVTESINSTLASWIEGSTNISKLEIKLMIAELCHVVSFLHEDAHVIHTSLSMDNIFINPSGHVKLSGLAFSLSDPAIGGADIKHSPTFPNALPLLKFVAPEIIQNNKGYYTSDIFSLGTIIFNLLKYNKGDTDRDIINVKETSNTIDSYKASIDVMDNKLMKMSFENDDNDIIFKALNKNPSSRPTIKEFAEHSWFNDPRLKALRFIENLEHNDAGKNAEFLTRFPNIQHHFDAKIIEKRFLPSFMTALKTETLIVNTLPAVFSICESTSFKVDFEGVVWPGLKVLFQMKQIPAAALYFLLSKLNFIAEKISNTEFSSNMLNIICKALDCGVAKIQTVVLDNLLFIIKKIDSLAFKNQIFPRLVNIVLNTNSTNLKLSILKSFTSVYSLLDQKVINDNLLDTMEKLRKSDNNAEVCMAIVAIYEEIAKAVSVEVIEKLIINSQLQIKSSQI
jgi:SCY1-like protein 2